MHIFTSEEGGAGGGFWLARKPVFYGKLIIICKFNVFSIFSVNFFGSLDVLNEFGHLLISGGYFASRFSMQNSL